jgi:hypothetical protein
MSNTTKIIDSTELRIGDVVHCHGGRFELVECLVDAARAEHIATHSMHATPQDIERDMTLRAFRGEFLGNVDDRWPCHIREFVKAEGWTVQGNKNARWHVEAAA